MPRSGWAYTDLGYFNELGGMTGSVQFRTDCNSLSGSTNFVFASSSNRVGIRYDLTQPGFDIQRGSTALPLYHPNAALEVRGDMNVTGSIYAKNYYIQNVSFMDFTGSTKFGDSSGDTHQFYGSIAVGPVAVFSPTSTLDVEGNAAIGVTYSGTTAAPTNGLIVEGKVGIGVADPDTQLEVFGSSTQQKWSFDADSYATVAVAASSHTTLATGEQGNFTLDAAGDIVLDADGGNIVFKDSGMTYIDFQINGTDDKMVVNGGLTIDASDDIILDADGDQISMKFGGAAGQIDFSNANSGDGIIRQMVDSKDLVIQQYDGAEVVRFGDDRKLYFYDNGGEHISGDSTNLTIASGNDIICSLGSGKALEPSADNVADLGSASKQWANLYTGDLHLKNDRGDWTIVEEAEYLTLTNNTNGKKYKIMMEEIED
jgi:hypothetical protein